MTDISKLPITRALRPATDLNAPILSDCDFALNDLFAASLGVGKPLIQGRTFRGCRIQGPGILMAGERVSFQDVNFGDNRGDIGNLAYHCQGAIAIGSIPFRDCVFESCEFLGVGFTGHDQFLAAFLTLTATGRDSLA